jgi:hypothetical protein
MRRFAQNIQTGSDAKIAKMSMEFLKRAHESSPNLSLIPLLRERGNGNSRYTQILPTDFISALGKGG